MADPGGEVDVERLRDDYESRIRYAERNYALAQSRTFQLSERIGEVEANAKPLRELLREVIDYCVPTVNCYALDPENIWYRAAVAADGGPAVLGNQNPDARA